MYIGAFWEYPRGRTAAARWADPTPGGEPLWHASGDLAIFLSALKPATKCCNRRLPRITDRDYLPMARIPRGRIRGQPVRRSPRSMLPAARSRPRKRGALHNQALAKSEGRERSAS
jgi:hypothetical protein